jgi:hypothetical protein
MIVTGWRRSAAGCSLPPTHNRRQPFADVVTNLVPEHGAVITAAPAWRKWPASKDQQAQLLSRLNLRRWLLRFASLKSRGQSCNALGSESSCSAVQGLIEQPA